MAEVVLDKVNKQYENGFHAVQDLDLDIAHGEFLVLVGPSGCGKSTALRMVAGLEDISSGTMKIGDRVVNTLSPKDRDIAMVFQSYALYPHMSVADNIAYGLKIRRMDKAEINKRVTKVPDMLELAPLLDRKPKQLSGGQRQRVAMGRAIVREPQVFLMDEPLSNLDAKLRVQMRSEIAQVQHDLDVTTIYVTHDQTEAMTMGDRVVNTLSPKDRDIAMVFQSYALYPHMSVADNIAYGLKIRRMDKAEIERRVNKVADMLELGPLLDRKPKQLSGGQRQRVAMGRAIVREPQVFLMDEPLSNLDAKLRVQMRSEIAQVQHDLDVTTIYVTHDQTEAMTMGDRVAVMKGGILQELGEPQYLYDNPANIFVAGFIGSPPMNLAVGKVVRPDGNGDLAVRLGSATIRLHPAVAKERPALASYVSREVAVGIRSEDMEDARLVRDAAADTRLKATVSLVEALGAQIVVHFDVDAPKVVTADTKLLDKDAHTDDVPTHEIEGTKFVAAFAPRSRVKIGDTIEVVVDTERMHFFDPETGEAIRG